MPVADIGPQWPPAKYFRMKISVVIPTYNSAATIQATLESVARQSVTPDEVLVLDDGSTDGTVGLLNAHRHLVTVLRQENAGVAAARSVLWQHAKGDLVAFLDHDDLWHPLYLEVQREMFRRHRGACSFFTGHIDFYGHGYYVWQDTQTIIETAEQIEPLDFFKQYNFATGRFGSMSFCCLPKHELRDIGHQPFRMDGVDDSYLCMLLPLTGSPVIYHPHPLVAYRITPNAQSVNKLKAFRSWVDVFELLEDRYQSASNRHLRKAFELAFASKRRSYSKLLMGSGEVRVAREQLWKSLRGGCGVRSGLKSFALMTSTYLPSPLQPVWPHASRVVRGLPGQPPNLEQESANS